MARYYYKKKKKKFVPKDLASLKELKIKSISDLENTINNISNKGEII